jgi:diphosphate-dependent phosphofructokinase
MTAKPKKIALLTAGGLAPCLSSAIGGLIERYTEIDPEIEIIAYRSGYKGLLLGDSIVIDEEMRRNAGLLHGFGGSPIGNSRVKLTNVKDCLKRGLVKEGEDPQAVAANQLKKDGVDVLHTIGGDDTNTAAADLARFLHDNGYEMRVIGLPKTIDNDVFPIAQTLGAYTAAEQTAVFFENVVHEHSSNPRMLIVHEVMGRHCGWLTAYSAMVYREGLDHDAWLPELGWDPANFDVHGIYLPEMQIDIDKEAERLKGVMDELDNVNIFLSEGAGVADIVRKMEADGQEVPRDPFGHVMLDKVNPGQYFAKQFAEKIGAEKVAVWKSGYFARSAAPNEEDLRLIKSCTDYAVECALNGLSGVIGHDLDHGGRLRAIEFERIKGGKPFDIDQDWFNQLLAEIGQEKGPQAVH